MESTSFGDNSNADTAQSSPVLRVAQLRSVAMLAPMMISSNLMMLVFFQWLYAGVGDTNIKTAWTCSLLFVLMCHSANWWHLEKRKRTKGLQRTLRAGSASLKSKIFLLSLLQGTVWGMSAVIYVEFGPPSYQAALAVAFSTMLVFGAAWLAPLPGATLAFVVPMLLAGSFALFSMPSSKVTTSLFIILSGLAVSTPMIATVYAKLLHAFFKSMEKLKRQRRVVTSLFQELEANSLDWVWETDLDGYCIRFPDSMSPRGVDPKTIRLLDYLRRIICIKGTQLDELELAFQSKTEFKHLLLCLQMEEDECWVRLSGHPVRDKDGNITGFLGTGSDVTLEKLAEERIAVLSQNDSLTGLVNRGAFLERLKTAVSQLERYGRPFSVLYLDLDNFKLVNDTQGHLFGDRLLAEASDRISGEVRDVDCVARLGGDEFAILLDDQGDASAASRLASRLVGEVCKPYIIDGQELKVGLSIGIALAPLNGTRAEQLMRNADLALYRAKADGRGVFRFFENSMDAEMRKKRMLEAELRNAIVNDEMVLHYQPLIDARSKKVLGMEALIRWQHPIRGLLSPMEFIQLAESTNLISDVGGWTLHKACGTATLWPNDIYVSVNISAYHFMSADFLDEVKSALRISGIRASRLELEITESLLIDNTQEVISKLDEIKKLGVSIAMDDFGTGYSSLSYLMSVPFDKLKIDKSFVDEICAKDTGKKIVRMITKLAQELGLRITAEGVENAEQVAFLTEVGCDTLQGYYFAKPMPDDQLAGYFLKQVNGNLETGAEKSIAS